MSFKAEILRRAQDDKTIAVIKWGRLALLMIVFAQLLGAAVRLSATVDEGFHITSGYEYLRTGNVRLFDEHPPLAKALLAWPLFFVPDLTPPEQTPGYLEGDLIAVAQATVLAYQPIARVIVACRIPVALLTVLLAASVVRWAVADFGHLPGLFVLALFAFDPNILAHGSLATTDVGTTLFIFWAIMALSNHALRKSRLHWCPRWWAAALLLGLAQGTKLTALILFPIGGILSLVNAWKSAAQGRRNALAKAALSYMGMSLIALLVLWSLYGFEVRPLPQIAGGSLPLPAASHIERWFRLQEHLDYGRESFLLGQNSMHGWWQYFPIAFLVKTPVPILLMVGCMLLLWAGRLCVAGQTASRAGQTNRLSYVLFPIVYGIASVTSPINIGYRHLLPILPCLYVAMAGLVSWYSRGLKRIAHPPYAIGLRLIGYGLLLWQTIGTLRVAPHYLPYFNEIAGGPENGWRFLADSNTDWGQTLKALATYQEENDLGVVKLSQFTFLDPATYGVMYEPIAPMRGAPPVLPRRFNPAPGIYAISATTLDGVPLPLPATFDWFRHREPFAKIGYAMFLYEVEPVSVTSVTHAATWVAQCTMPTPPLPPDIVTQGFGFDTSSHDSPKVSDRGVRQIYFDCERGWIFPDGGRTTGWYVHAPRENIDKLECPSGLGVASGPHWLWRAQPSNQVAERIGWYPDWIQQGRVLPAGSILSTGEGNFRLSYVQSIPGELPPFAIWIWKPREFDHPFEIGRGEFAVSYALTLEEAYINFRLEDALMFLGQTAPRNAEPGATVDVLTYWRVLTPPARPLSLMLHLSKAIGHPPIAVGDGVGVPIDQWREGDIIVQRHSLAIPVEASMGVYQLVSGAYWVDTTHPADGLTHLRLEMDDAESGDKYFVILGEIAIK